MKPSRLNTERLEAWSTGCVPWVVDYPWLCAAMLTLPHARTAVSPACRPQHDQPLHACPAAQAADTVLASRTSRVVGCCTQCWVGLTQVA